MKNKYILIAAACFICLGFFSAFGDHNPSGVYHSDSTKTEKIKADVQEEIKAGKTSSPDSTAKTGAAPKDTGRKK
jgi:hypothetical protein